MTRARCGFYQLCYLAFQLGAVHVACAREPAGSEEAERLQRQLTPRQQADIMQLGIPGIGFRTEKRRFYPGGATASHILGLTNIDNQGIAGMEKYIDDQGLADLRASGLVEPVAVSCDNDEVMTARCELAREIESDPG